MARKTKTIRATMFDDAFTVELEAHEHDATTFDVFVDDVFVGEITSHRTQSEQKISGSRLVRRGATFTAWAQRQITERARSLPIHQQTRFDYYAQTRSQSEAIRRLVRDARTARVIS